ncbi:MASE3 domain-containing protein [Clostridiaceae bacterium 35-E11]
MLSTRNHKKTFDPNYIYFVVVLIFAISLLQSFVYLGNRMYGILNITEFLAYHIIIEFVSVIISFVIFIVTYYTYMQNSRVRMLIFSSIFFIVGCLDFFHIMSYNGMPVFFTESSVIKATSFWVIARLILALGLLAAGIVPYHRKTTLQRIHFLIVSIIVTYGIFYGITYYTNKMPTLFVEGYGLTQFKTIMEYIIASIFCIAMAFFIRDYHITKDKIFLMVAMGLFFSAMTEMIFTWYKSVYDTYNMLGHIYKIISIYLIFKGIFVYNLDKPYFELKKARQQIKLYAQNLEKIVERRTQELQKSNKKMIEDLEYAKRIQQSLLPPRVLDIYGVQFISEYVPCEKVSGDFYHIHVLDAENIGMYIADVAGHGVSAAMMTVFADRIMKPSDIQGRKIKNLSPSKALAHFYREFNKSDFPNEMHIVMFKAIYNIKTKVLSYCSGGMNILPIVVKKNGKIEWLDKSIGFPICKFEDFYVPEYKTAEVKLEKGDRVIFYTDGLVENFKDNTLLEEQTFMHLLKKGNNDSLQVLNENILDEIANRSKDFQNEDDITYFIMEV